MYKVFASPSKYIQGERVLKEASHFLDPLGKKAYIVADDSVWKIVEGDMTTSLKGINKEFFRASFGGEASLSEIERLKKNFQENNCDFVIAMGGGKSIDTGKVIANALSYPIAVIPTIASTDAPTSALSVIYTDKGEFEKYIFYDKNPDLVLVDTQIIVKAPPRFLASGIADALATWVEARAVSLSYSKTMAGGESTLAGLAIAKKCEEVLFANGLQAMEANKSQVVTRAFENIVEANTLLSGLGFESGGLAAAHAVHNGFTALDGDIHHLTHGEKVAYGTLTQLVLQNEEKEILDKYILFYQALGLPTTLKELHLEKASYEDLLKIGKQACIEGESIHNMPFVVMPENVADAIVAVNSYVLKYFPR